jgi:hypothetical protein
MLINKTCSGVRLSFQFKFTFAVLLSFTWHTDSGDGSRGNFHWMLMTGARWEKVLSHKNLCHENLVFKRALSRSALKHDEPLASVSNGSSMGESAFFSVSNFYKLIS